MAYPPETTQDTRANLQPLHHLEERSSGSFASLVAITTIPPSWNRLPRLRGRAAESVTPLALTLPPPPPLAAPLEGRRGFVPMPGDGLEPGDDLAGSVWVLTVQGPPLQDPLDAL